jgi:hypothetical protein
VIKIKEPVEVIKTIFFDTYTKICKCRFQTAFLKYFAFASILLEDSAHMIFILSLKEFFCPLFAIDILGKRACVIISAVKYWAKKKRKTNRQPEDSTVLDVTRAGTATVMLPPSLIYALRLELLLVRAGGLDSGARSVEVDAAVMLPDIGNVICLRLGTASESLVFWKTTIVS